MTPAATPWEQISIGGPVEAVIPEPPLWSGLMIVGEAPGAAEVAHGRPFTGESGRLLDKLLRRAGIDRDTIGVTNTFRYQPAWSVNDEGKRRNNDIAHFFTDEPSKGNQRLPPLRSRYVRIGPDEHVRDLWRMVRRHRPRIIVTAGSIATWAMTGDGTLKDRIGELTETDCDEDVRILPTYHPAHALHKQDEAIAVTIAEHLMKAREILEEAHRQMQAAECPF